MQEFILVFTVFSNLIVTSPSVWSKTTELFRLSIKFSSKLQFRIVIKSLGPYGD